MPSDIAYPVRGACVCGAVSYLLHEAPLVVAVCHCRQCQAASGGAFGVSAMVRAEALECHGELREWRRTGASGQTSVAHFCPSCGSHVYHANPEAPDMLMLKPGGLADTRMIRPTVHVWTCEKQDWYVLPADVTAFETQPPR